MTTISLRPVLSATLAWTLWAGLCAGLCAAPALAQPGSAVARASASGSASSSAGSPGALGAKQQASSPALKPCRLKGLANEVQCGSLRRALNPAQPQGTQIDIHFAIVPALARNKRPDAVYFLAGGPGQSAIDIGGMLAARMARYSNRRDLVFVDQRGTGRSAPLKCPQDDPRAATAPLAQEWSTERMVQRLRDCQTHLQSLPHGDLRYYTTAIAMQDLDAVRSALGHGRINLIGGSYGTRAALDYLRQFPSSVRRTVIDGVAPPDMVLPAAFSMDNQAALEAVFAGCAAEAACQARYAQLRAHWQQLLARLPLAVQLLHPLTGRAEPVTLNRQMLTGMLRGPLYVPALAAGLPGAMHAATQGQFNPLLGLALGLGGGAEGLASGMHFSVICAEDGPRMAQSVDKPGSDFADGFADVYRQVCAVWPRGEVPAAFYAMPRAPTATLVLSGGVDPVTPPRHGTRATLALGSLARHVVVAQAGHGTLNIPCLRDQVFRFIDAASDEEALKLELDCAQAVPRPPAFVPLAPRTAAAAAAGGTR